MWSIFSEENRLNKLRDSFNDKLSNMGSFGFSECELNAIRADTLPMALVARTKSYNEMHVDIFLKILEIPALQIRFMEEWVKSIDDLLTRANGRGEISNANKTKAVIEKKLDALRAS